MNYIIFHAVNGSIATEAFSSYVATRNHLEQHLDVTPLELVEFDEFSDNDQLGDYILLKTKGGPQVAVLATIPVLVNGGA